MGAGNEGELDLDEQVQPKNAAELYDHIESWWGVKFDQNLIERMLDAPFMHKMAFFETLSYLWDADIVQSALTEVGPNILRPALPLRGRQASIPNILTGLRLLLYADEIVVDCFELYCAFDPRSSRRFRLDALQYWAKVRPLVEDGSLRLSPMRKPHRLDGGHVRKLLEVPEIMASVNQMASELDGLLGLRGQGIEDPYHPLRTMLEDDYGSISGACQLAAAHKAHILARSEFEHALTRVLLRRPATDNRQIDLQKLAILNVPTMSGDIAAMVEIRKSDADFREWRDLLRAALRDVGELSDDASSLDEASDIVRTHLSDGLSRVEKATKRSPALQALKHGVTGLVISGICGSTTAAITEDPLVGLVAGSAGAAAGMVPDTAFTYVKALQERRKGRLIMDVALLFDPSHSTEDI
jgi:hypothetical protein